MTSLASLVPTTFAELEQYCERFAASAFCPKDYRGKPGDVMIAMQMGSEVGLRPLQAVQSISVINGRPSVWGDGALALVRAAKENGQPLLEDFDEQFEIDGEIEVSGKKYPNFVAVCRAKRRGQETVIERRFSFADAMRAKLWGKDGPWTNYPKRMAQMRARSWVLRDGFADVLKGLHIREEVEDIETTATEIGQATPVSATAEATASKAEELKHKYRLPPLEGASPTDGARAVEVEVVKDDAKETADKPGAGKQAAGKGEDAPADARDPGQEG